jgi:hypothetical protein
MLTRDTSDKNEIPYSARTTVVVKYCIETTNIEEWMHQESENTKISLGKRFEKVKINHYRILPFNCADDPKRTIRNLTVKTSPMYSIPLRMLNYSGEIDGNNALILIAKELILCIRSKSFLIKTLMKKLLWILWIKPK